MIFLSIKLGIDLPQHPVIRLLESIIKLMGNKYHNLENGKRVLKSNVMMDQYGKSDGLIQNMAN
jgi:hypothetical protein